MNEIAGSSRQRFQKIVTWVSIVAFFGSTAYGAYGAINQAMNQPAANANAAVSPESQLQAQEKGYELVLEREPDNRIALEGLVATRLQMMKTKEAIAPLEKLVKLAPERQDYKTVLAQVKQVATDK